MQYFTSLDEVLTDRPTSVTVGVFDGLHRGHQYLLGQLVAQARQAGQQAALVSFYPHPDVVLKGIAERYYLTSPDEQRALLAEMGIDILVLHPFDATVRQMPAADFVDRLVERLQMHDFMATAEFALGYQREGDLAFLQQQGQAKGFAVHQINLQEDGVRISSSRIRQALADGDVVAAGEWLGRRYHVSGQVIPGDQRGRTIGFPTANLDVWPQKLIPANGVYACHATLGDQRHQAVINIGVRPTFDGHAVRVEAHLLDFDADIYGDMLGLEFVERLRGEQKFDGIEALIAQIAADVTQARQIFGHAALQKKIGE